MGFGKSFDGFDSNPDLESVGFAQRSLEKEVLLCRACGERAVYVKKVKHLTKEEQKKSDNAFSVFMFITSALFLIVGLLQINSVADTGQSIPGFAWICILAGVVFGAFGSLLFSKK
jgi:hypothetical protein